MRVLLALLVVLAIAASAVQGRVSHRMMALNPTPQEGPPPPCDVCILFQEKYIAAATAIYGGSGPTHILKPADEDTILKKFLDTNDGCSSLPADKRSSCMNYLHNLVKRKNTDKLSVFADYFNNGCVTTNASGANEKIKPCKPVLTCGTKLPGHGKPLCPPITGFTGRPWVDDASVPGSQVSDRLVGPGATPTTPGTTAPTKPSTPAAPTTPAPTPAPTAAKPGKPAKPEDAAGPSSAGHDSAIPNGTM